MDKIRDRITVPIGGMWDEQEFDIELNYPVMLSDITPCKHCRGPYQKEEKGWDGEVYTYTFYICPRVVVGVNEGHNNSTGVCVDCLLEALAGAYSPGYNELNYDVFFSDRRGSYHGYKRFSSLVEFSNYFYTHKEEIGAYRMTRSDGETIEDGKLTEGGWKIINKFIDNEPED